MCPYRNGLFAQHLTVLRSYHFWDSTMLQYAQAAQLLVLMCVLATRGSAEVCQHGDTACNRRTQSMHIPSRHDVKNRQLRSLPFRPLCKGCQLLPLLLLYTEVNYKGVSGTEPISIADLSDSRAFSFSESLCNYMGKERSKEHGSVLLIDVCRLPRLSIGAYQMPSMQKERNNKEVLKSLKAIASVSRDVTVIATAPWNVGRRKDVGTFKDDDFTEILILLKERLSAHTLLVYRTLCKPKEVLDILDISHHSRESLSSLDILRRRVAQKMGFKIFDCKALHRQVRRGNVASTDNSPLADFTLQGLNFILNIEAQHRARSQQEGSIPRGQNITILQSAEKLTRTRRVEIVQPTLNPKSSADMEENWTLGQKRPNSYKASIRDAKPKPKNQYITNSHVQGRVLPFRWILRYTACTGLINQHYSHIAAFTLAAALKSELVLPPAVQRDSFAKYFSLDEGKNEVSWTPAPLDTLLDVDAVIDSWEEMGMTIHKTPSLRPFPDLTQPQLAFPLYSQEGIEEKFITELNNVHSKVLDLDRLVAKARSSVLRHVAHLLRENPDEKIRYIVLDLPCTFFMLRTRSILELVGKVAASLDFSPAIKHLAQEIIIKMYISGSNQYNAVHLRIEKDARDWAGLMGGEGVIWHLYREAMQKTFNPALPLYVASGLLTYDASKEFLDVQDKLKNFNVCSVIYYKEILVGEKELKALTSEQMALLDFLVLANGQHFVGFGPSTFSFYLREYRALKGMQRSTSFLLNGTNIGTDHLFTEAGYAAPLKADESGSLWDS